MDLLTNMDSTLLLIIATSILVLIGGVVIFLLKPTKIKITDNNPLHEQPQEQKKESIQKVVEPQKNIQKEVVKPLNQNQPHKEYGIFDPTRAKEEFGLEDEEVQTFIEELKAQIEEELPIIKEYIEAKNFKELKNSVHKIKGSAVNLGKNGIAQLLFDFNHYLSEGQTNLQEINNMYEDILYYKKLI